MATRPPLWLLVALLVAMLVWHVVASWAEPCWRAWVVSVVETVDGDTVDLEVTWEPRRVAEVRVRLIGVDTPELKGATREAGERAKAFTATWLAAAGPLELVVCRPALDSFGRYLGRLMSPHKGDLGAALLAAGHAAPYVPR